MLRMLCDAHPMISQRGSTYLLCSIMGYLTIEWWWAVFAVRVLDRQTCFTTDEPGSGQTDVLHDRQTGFTTGRQTLTM